MEFHWLLENEKTLILMGYEQELARLEWDGCFEQWDIRSTFLEIDTDMGDEFTIEDVDEVQAAALETLIEHCEGKVEWWNGQIEQLKEIKQWKKEDKKL